MCGRLVFSQSAFLTTTQTNLRKTHYLRESCLSDCKHNRIIDKKKKRDLPIGKCLSHSRGHEICDVNSVKRY